MNFLTQALFWAFYSRFKDEGAREHLKQAMYCEIVGECEKQKHAHCHTAHAMHIRAQRA